MDTISIYTDGSCSLTDRSGGWSFVALMGDRYIDGYGYAGDTTVNRMELTGILQALTRIKMTNHPIRLFSDSSYSVDCINQWAARWELTGWRNREGEEIKNADLVKSIHQKVLEHRTHRALSIAWVKGHNKNFYNEKADRLAGMARVKKIHAIKEPKPVAIYKYVAWTGKRQGFVYVNAASEEITGASPCLQSRVGKPLGNLRIQLPVNRPSLKFSHETPAKRRK